MSGIAGIYRPGGAPVDRADLQRMVETIAHRGPDGFGAWNAGSVGLGHRMLWTTPESLQEELPLVKESGDLAITADARIDNREDLLAAVGLSGTAGSGIADSAVILAAYERWGQDCTKHLLGDFAFAIWDGRNQSLFCARDHFGVKPFYYYSSGGVFAFASEIKAILSLSDIPNRLDEERIADYLASIVCDNASTFYHEIQRLPPAHSMTVSRQGTQVRAYWSLDPKRELRLSSNEEYAEAFREIFTEAVRCRLRSAFPVGSLLSGGLDSSSVTGVARRLLSQDGGGRLATFSAIFDEVKQCDESRFINAVLAEDGLEPHHIHGDRLDPLGDIDRVLWHQDEPYFAPHLFMRWALNGSANKQCVRVLLDGYDGDTTVSHGLGYMNELAQKGRWVTLARQARGVAKTSHVPAWKVLVHYAVRYKLRSIAARYRYLSPLSRLLKGLLRRGGFGHSSAIGTAPWKSALDPDFVQRTGLKERYKAWWQAHPGLAPSEREQHYLSITRGIQPLALEVLDRAAAAFSIEPRFPLWDRRLVEFCLALPPEQKLHDGWSRMVMRRGMSHVLPPEIQWRRDKTDFVPSFTHAFVERDRARLEDVMAHSLHLVENYVDRTALNEIYQRFVSPGPKATPDDGFTVWKVVSLALWLRHIEPTSQYYNEGGTKSVLAHR